MFPRNLLCIVALATVALPAVARAQVSSTEPKFEFGKAEEVKKVEWHSQVKGGFTSVTGNSRMLNATASGTVSRKADDNRIALEAGAAYGRSSVIVARLPPGVTAITGPEQLGRDETVSTDNWAARGRYDRFLTKNNSAYVQAQLGADQIAGKKLQGGGQVGYSRQLVATAHDTLVAELGYDLSFEEYVSPPPNSPGSVAVHSARVYAGDLWKISGETGAYLNVEALFNLNRENAPVASDPQGLQTGVAAFNDTRVVGKAGITTTLWKNLGFGFGMTVKYDENPAPLPAIKGFTYGAPGMPYQPFAEKLDFIAEASLILTLL